MKGKIGLDQDSFSIMSAHQKQDKIFRKYLKKFNKS